MKLELVIFDMDGLMFDSESICYKGWKRALIEMGYEPDRDIYIESIGTGAKEACAIYKNKFGDALDFERLSRLTGAYRAEIITQEGLGIKKGLIALIELLNFNNIKKAIASSSARETIIDNLKLACISNDFDYIISGRELKNTKPDPEIFINVCEALGISRNHTIVLEDSINGVRAACSGGIKCIAVPDMVPVNEEMLLKSYAVEDSLLAVKDFFIQQYNLKDINLMYKNSEV